MHVKQLDRAATGGLVVSAGRDVETRNRAIGLDTEKREHLHGNIRPHQAGPSHIRWAGAAGAEEISLAGPLLLTAARHQCI